MLYSGLNKLEGDRQVLKIRMTDGFRLQKNKLEAFDEKKRLIDPVRVLQRGYSLTYKEGKIIKSVTGLGEGDELQTRFADGNVVSKIIEKQ
jgi:exodeoxyribonuclease VII large subunit